MMRLLLALLISGSAWAIDRPVPIPYNGIVHTSQIPVLFAADGDTLRAGWSGPAAITIPDPAGIGCTGGSGTGGGGYVIRDDAGFAELEKATLLYDTFWICPGDYNAAVGGQLNLSDSGTARTDAGLIKVMCLQPDMTKNPWQNSNGAWEVVGHPFLANHDSAKECIMPELDATGVGYWFFHGVTFAAPTWSTQVLAMVDNSPGMVFDRVWNDGSYTETSLSSKGTMLIRFQNGADNGVVQNSALGPQAPVYDLENQGVSVRHSTDNTWIANNRFWNIGHQILNGGNFGYGVGEGTHIKNNDFTTTAYLTELGSNRQEWFDRDVKCSTHPQATNGCGSYQATTRAERRFDPLDPTMAPLFAYNDRTQKVSCMQSFISMKHGSQNPANPAVVQYNRAWGHRPTTTNCAGDNQSVLQGGIFSSASWNAENTHYLDNIIFDNAGFFISTPTSTEEGANRTGIRIEQNVGEFSDVSSHPFVNGTNNQAAWDTNMGCTGECQDVPGYQDEIKVRFNTATAVPANIDPNMYSSDPFDQNYNKTYATFDCNLAFESGSIGSNPSGAQNVVVDGSWYSSLTETVDLNAPDVSSWGDFTFQYDLQQATPPSYTIPNIIPPDGWQYSSHCTQPGPTYDMIGDTRLSSSTPGAFIAGGTLNPGMTYHYEYRINGGTATLVQNATSPATITGLQVSSTDTVETRVRLCDPSCGSWSAWATAIMGIYRPVADANEYTSYYQKPILQPYDALDTNWSTRPLPYPQLQAGYTPSGGYTIPDLSGIDCTGTADVQNGLRVLKAPADLAELEGTPAYREFVLCPGDYKSDGRLNLGTGGTGSTDAAIRKVYCSADTTKNPVQRNAAWRGGANPFQPNHNSAVECMIEGLDVNGVSNWLLAGISISESTTSTEPAVFVRNGDTLILDRVWVACYGTDLDTNSVNATCMSVGDAGQFDNFTVQSSVIGPCTPANDWQQDVFRIYEGGENIHVVDTDIVDCSRAIITGSASVSGTAQYQIAENNDIYRTDFMRATCDPAAWSALGLGDRNSATASRIIDPSSNVFDVNGACACGGEGNFLQHKTSFINNRVHGYRATAGLCMASNSDAEGVWAILRGNPGASLFVDNYIHARRGITMDPPWGASSNYQAEFIRNQWEMTTDVDEPHVPSTNRRYITLDTQGCTGCLTNSTSARLNRFSAPPAVTLGTGSIGNVTDPFVFDCNEVFGSTADASGSGTGQDNTTIDGADLSGWTLTNTDAHTLSEAGRVPFTFWRTLQTTPVQYTSPPLQPTFASKPTTVCEA